MRIHPLIIVSGLLAACGSGSAPSTSSEDDAPVTHEVTLLYSARLEGEIEPCGCPKDPMGGLTRRNQVIAEHRAEGPVLVVDGGLSLNPLAPTFRSPGGGITVGELPLRDLDQRRIKAELIVDAFLLGGIDAMALGSSDWALGGDWVRELIADRQAPVVAANLWCDGRMPYPGAVRVERGGQSIVVAGVTEGPVEGCEVREPGPALREALDQAGPADLKLALIPSDGEAQVAAVLDSGMEVDLVVDGRGQHTRGRPDHRHQAWLLTSGTRGKHLARAVLKWSPGGEGWAPEGYGAQLADRLARSESRVEAHRAQARAVVDDQVRARIEQQIEAYEQQVARHREALERFHAESGGTHRFATSEIPLSVETMKEDEPTRALLDAALERIRASAPGSVVSAARAAQEGFGRTWAGSEACASCHPAEHAQWSATPHADAWQTLVEARREMDTACFGCHATGVGQPDGPVSPVDALHLPNVQCEACHGPSRAHASAPLEEKPPGLITPQTCTGCHDGEQDGGRFDYSTYLPRVRHGG